MQLFYLIKRKTHLRTYKAFKKVDMNHEADSDFTNSKLFHLKSKELKT
jgi:hypothetical protein